jgi:FecR protein
MTRTLTFSRGLLACGLALAMVSSLAAQTMTDGTAKVIRMKGDARYVVPGGTWKPVHAGLVLKPGTLIQTDKQKGSFVDLVLGGSSGAITTPAVYNSAAPASAVGYQPKAEQNTIRLSEDTALSIDKLSSMNTGADVVSDTQLDLRRGRILGNVKKMSAASKYEIKLPNGVAGVRGTFFDITADGLVRVLVGSMVLAYVQADGTVNTQVISALQQYDARSGQLSPIAANDLTALQAISQEMRPLGGSAVVSYSQSPDHTIRPVSPHGPPFTPPGPPPVTPP